MSVQVPMYTYSFYDADFRIQKALYSPQERGILQAEGGQRNGWSHCFVAPPIYMHARIHTYKETSCRLMPISCPPFFPTAPCLLSTPFHRSEMLTLQAIHFMNTTLKGKKPSHKLRTMLSSLLRNLKRSREEKTPLELQADCDWCVPISSSVLSLWMARTASGL